MTLQYLLVISAGLCVASCAKLDTNAFSLDECPENWTQLATGCYLFAIPEVLDIDHSCKVEGKFKSNVMLKFTI